MTLWKPTDLPTGRKPTLWLRGDDLTGSNGSTITSWPDASGNGNNGTYNGFGTSSVPVLRTASLNGLNVAELDGACGFSLPDFISSDIEGSAFFIYKLDNDPPLTGQKAGPVLGNWSGGASLISHTPYADGNIYDSFMITYRVTCGNPTVDLSNWSMIGERAVTNTFKFDINGVEFYQQNGSTGAAYGGNSPKIGIADAGGANYFGVKGRIAEVIYCPKFLTISEKRRIEGYLAWKWGLQNNLAVGHPYKVAAPTTLWNPSDLDDVLKAWWDYSDATTLTKSGSNITAVADKSPTGNALSVVGAGSNAGSGSATVAASTGPGSLGIALLAETGFEAYVASRIFNAGLTFASVWEKTGAWTNYNSGPLIRNGGSAGNQYPGPIDSYNSSRFKGDGDSATFDYITNAPDLASDTRITAWNVFVQTLLNNLSFYEYINGTNVVSQTFNSAGYGDSSYRLSIGTRSDYVTSLNASIGESVACTALDDTNRQKLEGYLAWKWALDGLLPSGHPYKSAAPMVVALSAELIYKGAGTRTTRYLGARTDANIYLGPTTKQLF